MKCSLNLFVQSAYVRDALHGSHRPHETYRAVLDSFQRSQQQARKDASQLKEAPLPGSLLELT